LVFPLGSFVVLAGLIPAARRVRARFHKDEVIGAGQIERRIDSRIRRALPGFWQPASGSSV
jgi:hypothetical protein